MKRVILSFSAPRAEAWLGQGGGGGVHSAGVVRGVAVQVNVRCVMGSTQHRSVPSVDQINSGSRWNFAVAGNFVYDACMSQQQKK